VHCRLLRPPLHDVKALLCIRINCCKSKQGFFFFLPFPDANISTKTFSKNSASGKHLAWKKNLNMIDVSCAAFQAPDEERFGGRKRQAVGGCSYPQCPGALGAARERAAPTAPVAEADSGARPRLHQELV